MRVRMRVRMCVPVPVLTRAVPSLACLKQAIQGWHAAGFLHRDVKPSNLAMDATGHVVVLDAGLALHTSTHVSDGEWRQRVGTRGYIAPEIEGGSGRWSEKADVYSVGATFHSIVRSQSSCSLACVFHLAFTALELTRCCFLRCSTRSDEEH